MIKILLLSAFLVFTITKIGAEGDSECFGQMDTARQCFRGLWEAEKKRMPNRTEWQQRIQKCFVESGCKDPVEVFKAEMSARAEAAKARNRPQPASKGSSDEVPRGNSPPQENNPRGKGPGNRAPHENGPPGPPSGGRKPPPRSRPSRSPAFRSDDLPEVPKECFLLVAEKAKSIMENCVQKKFPEFKLPSDMPQPDEADGEKDDGDFFEEPGGPPPRPHGFGGPKGFGPRLRGVGDISKKLHHLWDLLRDPEICPSSVGDKAIVCVQGVFNDFPKPEDCGANPFSRIVTRHQEMCKNVNECKAKISDACKPRLNETKQAMCGCSKAVMAPENMKELYYAFQNCSAAKQNDSGAQSNRPRIPGMQDHFQKMAAQHLGVFCQEREWPDICADRVPRPRFDDSEAGDGMGERSERRDKPPGNTGRSGPSRGPGQEPKGGLSPLQPNGFPSSPGFWFPEGRKLPRPGQSPSDEIPPPPPKGENTTTSEGASRSRRDANKKDPRGNGSPRSSRPGAREPPRNESGSLSPPPPQGEAQHHPGNNSAPLDSQGPRDRHPGDPRPHGNGSESHPTQSHDSGDRPSQDERSKNQSDGKKPPMPGSRPHGRNPGGLRPNGLPPKDRPHNNSEAPLQPEAEHTSAEPNGDAKPSSQEQPQKNDHFHRSRSGPKDRSGGHQPKATDGPRNTEQQPTE